MTIKPRVNIQKATQAKNLPTTAQFTGWAIAALTGRNDGAELTIRIVDEEESGQLNSRYRHKDFPTNVLSFPASFPASVPSKFLGDMMMCAPLVMREAAEQGKTLEAHWAHLTLHGTLHLLGYDHENASQAAEMESLETAILADLGYPDPYSI